MATLILSVKLNDIDPQAWLADVLANIADTPPRTPRAIASEELNTKAAERLSRLTCGLHRMLTLCAASAERLGQEGRD